MEPGFDPGHQGCKLGSGGNWALADLQGPDRFRTGRAVAAETGAAAAAAPVA